MNKKNYFKILRDELKRRNVANIEDIIEEYEDLIYQKMKEGKTEDEAVRELGSIEELANSYGRVKVEEGKADYVKFILLQVINLIVGFAIIGSLILVALSFIAVMISMGVVSIIAIVKLLTGAFLSIGSVLMVLAICALTVFLIGLFAILTRLIFIIVYNYIIYNINALKKKKLLYKKVRVGKIIPTITAVSLLLVTTLTISSAAIERQNWDNQAYEVLETISYNSNDSFGFLNSGNIKLLDENIEFEFEDVDKIDVTGINVIIEKGKENKVESNYEIGYEIVNDELIITVDDKYVGFSTGFNFFNSTNYPELVITLKDEMEVIKVDSVNVEITDVEAKEYSIDAVNLYIQLAKNDDEFDIRIDSINLEGYFKDLEIGEMKIDLINSEIEFTNVNITNFTASTINIDLEVLSSEFGLMDVSDSLNVDIDLEDSIIEVLLGKDFLDDFDIDNRSEINSVK